MLNLVCSSFLDLVARLAVLEEVLRVTVNSLHPLSYSVQAGRLLCSLLDGGSRPACQSLFFWKENCDNCKPGLHLKGGTCQLSSHRTVGIGLDGQKSQLVRTIMGPSEQQDWKSAPWACLVIQLLPGFLERWLRVHWLSCLIFASRFLKVKMRQWSQSVSVLVLKSSSEDLLLKTFLLKARGNGYKCNHRSRTIPWFYKLSPPGLWMSFWLFEVVTWKAANTSVRVWCTLLWVGWGRLFQEELR